MLDLHGRRQEIPERRGDQALNQTTVQNQQLLLQALAFLIDNLGYRIAEGRELFFADEKIAALGGEGQLQVGRHPEKPGFCVRYFPNRTIDIEAVKSGGTGGGPIQSAQADTGKA